MINKKRQHSKRIKDPSELVNVFSILGSNLNPILTQLAKTRRVVFVEGLDFQIISRFATKLGLTKISTRSEFAVVPISGFSLDRIRTLKAGMQATLGGTVLAASILDRDYRSDEECKSLVSECESFCDLATIHGRKEIENFLLIVHALDRAAERRVSDSVRRSGSKKSFSAIATEVLEEFSEHNRAYVASQYLSERKRFMRKAHPSVNEATVNLEGLKEFEKSWGLPAKRLEMIPGKDALSAVNDRLQKQYGVSITPTGIIDSMHSGEVPDEMRTLLLRLAEFADQRVE